MRGGSSYQHLPQDESLQTSETHYHCKIWLDSYQSSLNSFSNSCLETWQQHRHVSRLSAPNFNSASDWRSFRKSGKPSFSCWTRRADSFYLHRFWGQDLIARHHLLRSDYFSLRREAGWISNSERNGSWPESTRSYSTLERQLLMKISSHS